MLPMALAGRHSQHDLLNEICINFVVLLLIFHFIFRRFYVYVCVMLFWFKVKAFYVVGLIAIWYLIIYYRVENCRV